MQRWEGAAATVRRGRGSRLYLKIGKASPAGSCRTGLPLMILRCETKGVVWMCCLSHVCIIIIIIIGNSWRTGATWLSSLVFFNSSKVRPRSFNLFAVRQCFHSYCLLLRVLFTDKPCLQSKRCEECDCSTLQNLGGLGGLPLFMQLSPLSATNPHLVRTLCSWKRDPFLNVFFKWDILTIQF